MSTLKRVHIVTPADTAVALALSFSVSVCVRVQFYHSSLTPRRLCTQFIEMYPLVTNSKGIWSFIH